MEPYQQRVVDEHRDLRERLGKLASFMTTPIFVALPKDEQSRLIRQHSVMDEYDRILRERIAAFQSA